jgi:hypothetical protein
MKNIILAINKTLITLMCFDILSTVCSPKALSVIIVKDPLMGRGRRSDWGYGYGRRGVI